MFLIILTINSYMRVETDSTTNLAINYFVNRTNVGNKSVLKDELGTVRLLQVTGRI